MKLFAAVSAPLMVCLLAAMTGCAASSDSEGVGDSAADLSAAHPAPAMTVSQLESAINDEDNWLSNADGCTFTSKKVSGGLELTLKADGGTVTLSVDKDAKITMKDKSNGDDGLTVYTIAHVGTVEIEHADDAFDRFALTSDSGKKSTCEVDF
jgi:hypothetical protein